MPIESYLCNFTPNCRDELIQLLLLLRSTIWERNPLPILTIVEINTAILVSRFQEKTAALFFNKVLDILLRKSNFWYKELETTTFISKEDHRRVDRSHSFHKEQPREEKPKTRNRAKSSHFRRQYDAGLKNYPKQADGASRQTNVGKPAKIFKHPEYSRRATANLQGQRPRNTQEPRLKQLPLAQVAT